MADKPRPHPLAFVLGAVLLLVVVVLILTGLSECHHRGWL